MPSLTNHWWEILVRSDCALEELVFWRLQMFGCQGTASQVKGTQISIRAYLPTEKASSLDLAALSLLLRQDAIVSGQEPPIAKWVLIDEEDWSSSWKQHWHPQEIGDSFTIYPAWIEPPQEEQRHILRLDPGSAFGTGAHATTQLCLEALEMRLYGLTPDSTATFADIGCGSGILSIGAVLLNAHKVYAVDTDILAIKATHHNRELNHIPEDKIWVTEGNLDTLLAHIPEPVNGFACNILADVIVELIPKFEQLIKPDGWGILSGILVEQFPKVAEVLDKHKWIVATLWKRQEWSCLTIRRS
ncbi:50S ribosomal protein L11 methyltransferase [Tumidithrix elongata RA019]|uniref:Ribosomal protein L11 methyltransferase n=1 Tax=Tumidithrix elongata BACA0141 TaxID=2716417 RepID=A0AAW9PXH6_9CYAN|nr:50S ribosomal protein L11 methyltransferase [Tumidithrix elongata RA019]